MVRLDSKMLEVDEGSGGDVFDGEVGKGCSGAGLGEDPQPNRDIERNCCCIRDDPKPRLERSEAREELADRSALDES